MSILNFENISHKGDIENIIVTLSETGTFLGEIRYRAKHGIYVFLPEAPEISIQDGFTAMKEIGELLSIMNKKN